MSSIRVLVISYCCIERSWPSRRDLVQYVLLQAIATLPTLARAPHLLHNHSEINCHDGGFASVDIITSVMGASANMRASDAADATALIRPVREAFSTVLGGRCLGEDDDGDRGRTASKLILPGNYTNIWLRQPKECPNTRLDEVVVLLSTATALG